MLTIEYLAEPGAVAAFLPPPLEPVADRPDAVAAIWAEWQWRSESGEEELDPVRSQYKECLVVVRCHYQGQDWSRCLFIWVDQDASLLRGYIQGYPKKLGEIWMTRPALIGCAGPRLAPGGRFGATVAAGSRRLMEADFTITGEAESAGFVNAHPMLHHRILPSVEADGSDALHEIVKVTSEVELGTAYIGDASLRVFLRPPRNSCRLRPEKSSAAAGAGSASPSAGGRRSPGVRSSSWRLSASASSPTSRPSCCPRRCGGS